MSKRLLLLGSILSYFLFSSQVRGDDPVMNMMPRWSGGWGYQVHYEYINETDLLMGSNKLYPGLSEEINVMHFEGVYTWKKEIRVTVKLPYVLDAEREMPDGAGGKLIQKDSGWGDLNLGLPLKKYFNLDGKSGSSTFKPMVRIPLAEKDEYDFYYKEFGVGLGLGHEFETSNYYFGIGTAWWIFDGNRPAELHSSLDVGYNFETKNSNGSIFWETDFRFEDDESRTLSSGPALYFNHNDTIHSRIEWKHDLIDHQGIMDHGNGNHFKVGIGWVF